MNSFRRTGPKQSISSESWQSMSESADHMHSHSTEYYQNLAYQKSYTGKLVLNHRVYYICALIINGLLLSFYAVMAFTPHYPCLT
jgi:hypothetical protein